MTKTPLAGRRIALTRPATSSADWRARLETLGAEVVELPLIQVSKDVNLHTLNEVFQEIGGYEWIVFTSVNGVKYFFEEFHRVYDDIRAFGLMRIAVVGEATAAAVTTTTAVTTTAAAEAAAITTTTAAITTATWCAAEAATTTTRTALFFSTSPANG